MYLNGEVILIKKTIHWIFILTLCLFMCSCSNIKQKRQYLCEYISFERSGGNVLICALLCDTENISANIKELQSEPVTTTAATLSSAFNQLQSLYPDIYYKALKAVVISENLKETDKQELLSLFLNKTYLPLNIDVHIPKNISCALYLNSFSKDAEIEILRLWDYMQTFSENNKEL